MKQDEEKKAKKDAKKGVKKEEKLKVPLLEESKKKGPSPQKEFKQEEKEE